MGPGAVAADKWAQYERRRVALGVRTEDLEESFVRAGGPGGQHVNKASTCVVLRHRPTGLQVKCQSSRHQALNRFLARRWLLDKIERQRHGVVAAEQARIARIRRQKRRRSRRARERLLADKKHRTARKAARQPVREE